MIKFTWLGHATWLIEQAQALVVKVSQNRSRNRRSKAALCAMTSAAAAANDPTAAGSMECPATISSEMPVMAVISDEIGAEGCRNP